MERPRHQGMNTCIDGPRQSASLFALNSEGLARRARFHLLVPPWRMLTSALAAILEYQTAFRGAPPTDDTTRTLSACITYIRGITGILPVRTPVIVTKHTSSPAIVLPGVPPLSRHTTKSRSPQHE